MSTNIIIVSWSLLFVRCSHSRTFRGPKEYHQTDQMEENHNGDTGGITDVLIESAHTFSAKFENTVSRGFD